MKHLFILKSYFLFLFRSQSRYSIHSPFVYELLTKTIKTKEYDDSYQIIKKLRAELKANNQFIHIDDFGAGSRNNKALKIKRRVADIAKLTSVRDKYAKMLFRLISHFKPQTILELGTSLGISSALFSVAAPKSEIHTIEGSEEILNVAKRNFSSLELKNINCTKGLFDDVLPAKLKAINKLDFVFFDGNHRKEPTIKYFEQCLAYKHNESVFVFDDIHWSEGMEEAWRYIKAHPESIVCIDLFFMGIVFFKKELSKQEFIYKL